MLVVMNIQTQRLKYGLIAFGASLGAMASFLQMVEKLSLLKNPSSDLICNVNSVLNCTNVLNAPQSAVFGFPNALLSLVLFVLFLSVALVGATGGMVSRSLRISIQLMSIFMLGFGMWFLWQSTFVIGSICLYCLANFLGLIIVNVGWLRLNYADFFKSKSITKKLEYVVSNNFDLMGWGLVTLLVLVTIYINLGLG